MIAGARIPIALLVGFAVTFFLFRLMYLLIAMADMALDEGRGRTDMDFLRVRQDSSAQQRKRELPQRAKPKAPPKTPEMDRSNDSNADTIAVNVGSPDINTGLDMGKMNLNTTVADSEEVPIVRVEPIYPRRAAEQFIEGWVVLKFDITTTGATSNVKVVDANPKRIFDRAAARAVSKWKYRPKIVDGKALITKNVKVRLTFKLN